MRRLGFSDDDWSDPKTPSDGLVDALVAWGGLDHAAQRVEEHFEAGASHVAVQVLRQDSEIPLEEWRDLAAVLL